MWHEICLENFLSACYDKLEESSVFWGGRSLCGTWARLTRHVRHALAGKRNLAIEGESVFWRSEKSLLVFKRISRLCLSLGSWLVARGFYCKVYNSYHHKYAWINGGRTFPVLNIRTRYRWLISFTLGFFAVQFLSQHAIGGSLNGPED